MNSVAPLEMAEENNNNANAMNTEVQNLPDVEDEIQLKEAKSSLSTAAICSLLMGIGLVIIGAIALITGADQSLLSMTSVLKIIASSIGLICCFMGSSNPWLCTTVQIIAGISIFLGEVSYRWRIDRPWQKHMQSGDTRLSLVHGIFLFLSSYTSVYLFYCSTIYRQAIAKVANAAK